MLLPLHSTWEYYIEMWSTTKTKVFYDVLNGNKENKRLKAVIKAKSG